ncbi:SCL-interrupting locus protein homolog [Exaiptasia diaphana]|uniref:STIL N-terminal domain-containing protein n=1 Tax=Exaiptasia diaphana TaxID=2652724 RepID=A0A913X9I6_EXADI|nr:SCL-interrupting locus protein homolog [Exaiptasia diaphana]
MSCMQAQQPRPSSSYFPNKQETEKTSKHNTRESNDAAVVQPFHFPPTKQVWWDRKAQGSPEILHLTSKRNLRVQLNEKTLRLGIKHLNKSSIPSYDCFFIGSLFIDSREDAVEINIDRFDPGREFTDKGGFKTKVPTTVVPGDQVIPLKLVKGLMGAQQTATHSKQDFQKTFELLHSRFSGQEQLSLSNFISTKACCYAHTEAEELILNIQVGAVTMATSILATPVSPVPIIPTALARNLTGPLRLSDVQGVPKCGFLTMDHTRKLLLLLESDPKAYSLPLVGV